MTGRSVNGTGSHFNRGAWRYYVGAPVGEKGTACMVSYLWTGYVGGWSTTGLTGNQSAGVRFSVTADIPVTQLGYYAAGSGSGNQPSALRLWREDTATEVATVSAPSLPGGAGWVWNDVDAPYTMLAGKTYRVVASFASGKNVAYTGSGVPATPDSPLTTAAPRGCYSSSVTAYPDSTTSDNAWGADVKADASAPSPPAPDAPATTAIVRYVLDEYLSSDAGVNVHETDLPWRTDANVTTVKNAATGTSGFAAIKGVVDTILTRLGDASSGAIQTINGISAGTATLLARLSESLVTTLNNTSANVVSALNSLANLTAGDAGGTSGALSGRSGFPTLLWTLTDERDWTGELAWDVPADLYVLSITDANGAPPTVVAGVNWYPRLGWWAPLTSTLVGDRRFFEFESCRLEDGGKRMAGILLKANDGFVAGHIQAWMLT